MYNEFDKEEFMMDEDEVETPKKKDGWASDEEIDNPDLEPEDDDEEESDEEEEEPPM